MVPAPLAVPHFRWQPRGCNLPLPALTKREAGARFDGSKRDSACISGAMYLVVLFQSFHTYFLLCKSGQLGAFKVQRTGSSGLLFEAAAPVGRGDYRLVARRQLPAPTGMTALTSSEAAMAPRIGPTTGIQA